MPKKFFPFGDFARDSTDYDQPSLDEANRVLPVHGVYRPIRKNRVVSRLVKQGELTPWIDFDGTVNGKVDLPSNPIVASSGLLGKFTISVRCRMDVDLVGGSAVVATGSSSTANMRINLGSDPNGSPQFVIDGGLGETLALGRGVYDTSPGSGWHILTVRSTSDTANEFEFSIDGLSETEETGSIGLVDTTDWNSRDMGFGQHPLGGFPHQGDIERVFLVVGEALSQSDVDAIMEDPFDGMSPGGFTDGHLWLIRQNSGTTVFDYASSGALNGTMDTGATWEGLDFGTSEPSGITGGLAHFYTSTKDSLFRLPEADIDEDGWLPFGNLMDDDGEVSANPKYFERLNEKEPDDSDGAVLFGDVTGEQTLEVKLEGVPDPGVDTGHIVSYRYRFNGSPDAASIVPLDDATIELELVQGTTVISTLPSITTESPDDEWRGVSEALSSGDIANITNYDDLRIRVKGTITNGVGQSADPDEDLENPDGWLQENGDDTDLFESITPGSGDATFVETNGINSGGSSSFRFGLSDIEETPNPLSGTTWTARISAVDEGMDATIRILEDGVVRFGQTKTDIPTTPTTFVLNPADKNVAKIENWAALQGEVIFKSHGESDPDNPDGGLQPTAFDGTKVNATGTISDLLLDDDNTVDVGGGGLDGRFRVFLEAGSDPGTNDSHQIRLRAHRTGGNASASVQLYRGGGNPKWDSRDVEGPRLLSTSEQLETWDVPASVIQNLGGYNNLKIQVLTHAPASGGTAHYDTLSFTYPGAGDTTSGGRKGRVYEFNLDAPSRGWIGVSWLRLTTPNPDSPDRPDVTELYAGDYNSIYEVNSEEITDVSKAGGYAASAIPRSWSMVSYGENAIASNKVDPVQIRSPGDALFSDLMTSSAKPQFASLAVVQRHLIGANVSYTDVGQLSGPDGEADEWWCSAFDDPADFQVAAATGANRGRTVETPGEIVGMTGGEFALLFKRKGIHRLDWVGPVATFRPDVISSTDGTIYPRSIVQVESDVFFLDQDGFKVVESGQRVMRIGDGAVNRMITDTQYEDRAVVGVETDEQPLQESTVIGAYDKLNNLVWWSINTRRDTRDWRNDLLLIYNIHENRWSILEPDDPEKLRITHLWGLPPQIEASTSLSRGIATMQLTGGFPLDYKLDFSRFLQRRTYSSVFRTKIWSSNYIYNQPGRDYQLNFVRPSYRMGDNSVSRPDVSIKIRAADDPLMQFDILEDEVFLKDANSDLWYPVRVQGEYMDFEINFPEMSNNTIREIRGIELDFEDAGGR